MAARVSQLGESGGLRSSLAGEERAERGAVGDGGGGSVLLVDDDANSLTAISAALGGASDEIVAVASGSEALRELLDRDFALIIMDVRMPDLDGLATAEMIRRRPRSRATPIIFLTGLREEEDLFRAYELGAVDYLFKPVVPQVLRAKAEVFLRLGRDAALIRRQMEELALRNLELAQAREEMARSHAELNEFAGIAAHDLKEPLRTIAGHLQLMREDLPAAGDASAAPAGDFSAAGAGEASAGTAESGAPEAAARAARLVRSLDAAAAGAARLQRLIDDLLAYARLGATAPTPRWVDMERVMATARESLSGAIAAAGASVRVASPLPRVWGVGSQLGQLAQNLLANSLKFTVPERAPEVEITAARDFETTSRPGLTPPSLAHPVWRFSVRDNGLGFDMKYLDRIFLPFQRLHGRHQYGGTGIGLALCKKIVALHGGVITAQSEPGRGATFSFTLPLRQEPENEAEAAQKVATGGSRDLLPAP